MAMSGMTHRNRMIGKEIYRYKQEKEEDNLGLLQAGFRV